MAAIRLPRNVQFMYEHALALREFRDGFGVARLRVNRMDPWVLYGCVNGNVESILRRSAYAGTVDGRESVYSLLMKPAYQGGKYNRTRSVNQYLTHWIYPYKGKFHPQMIRALLNILHVRPGATVMDSFLGSGTAALECQMLGVNCIGVDISPLCVALARVKTACHRKTQAIAELVDRLIAEGVSHPSEANPSDSMVPEVRDFLMIAQMVTYSDMVNRRRKPETRFKYNLQAMLESVRAMARARRRFGLKFGRVSIRQGDARRLSECGIQDGSVDAVITSPPYSLALDYVKNDQAALSAMGLDTTALKEDFIGVRGRGNKTKLQLYNEDMMQAFGEIVRVLKPGAPAAVVVGDATVDRQECTTVETMIEWAADVGLTLDGKMPKIVWGLYNVMSDEKILFFRKEGSP